MQLANVLVSLGGDHGNTVSKFQVTAAEIAVLRAIHGDDAVNDVEPQGDIVRTHREERGRLLSIYGAAKTPDHKPIVEGMFPGVAARVFETLDELGLDDSMFKAVTRMKAAPSAAAPLEDSLDFTTPVPEAETVDDAEEGVGDDINDEHAEKPGILG